PRSYRVTCGVSPLSLHVPTESHSLSLLATLISGESPFPEFSMLLKVNDIPVEYGDSVVNGAVSLRHWSTYDTGVEQPGTHVKMNLRRLMKHFNHTQGIRVYQTLTACDETKFVIVDAYDGEEVRSYDFQQHTFHARLPEILWTKVQMEATKVASTNVFHPLCVRTLKRYLRMDKNVLLRKGNSRLFTEPDSGRTRVSCVATGFYPRRVNVTLLRDDRPVPDRELTGGEVLPNGDGTYQLRRSLSVSEEELRERHRYTCTVSHLSVDNKLDVTVSTQCLWIPSHVLQLWAEIAAFYMFHPCPHGPTCDPLVHEALLQRSNAVLHSVFASLSSFSPLSCL
uniref:Ig-like domain-containing protein n=1 Tax=Scleropages formosus TaxID=113540 RepID=A0A8C9RE82_SCLFO